MFKFLISILILALFLSACNNNIDERKLEKENTMKIDTVSELKLTADSLALANKTIICGNDSLNNLANIISGIADTNSIFKYVQNSKYFKSFSSSFEKRWDKFDSARLTNLNNFRETEISKIVSPQNILFYPFSGPDILYAQTFFPDAEKYVMIGLEPIGSLPSFKKEELDSSNIYYNKVNTALNAILKFSFFRTASMSKDLKNTEVDGTLHLLFLFLKRKGNSICSAKPVVIDSLGETIFLNSFSELKKKKSLSKGVEIKFTDVHQQPKTLYYFSLNASDGGLKTNKGFVSFLTNLGVINTYLKGASYLMHKGYFSIIRNVILKQSKQVIQDDSGIAFHYFTNSESKWKYIFYGKYLKPISMFSQFYQADLDSSYIKHGSKPIGFGIGYNFRDKNSNFMVAIKEM